MAPKFSEECVVGGSPSLLKLLKLVQKVGNSDVAVLLQGESGTGKELVARLIYSGRPKGQFVPIDCGALPANLVESELFGHERGAFTGALASRSGLLQTAHGGTVFFDEVGELPPEAQAKLLRALQQREIRPVGSDQPRPCRFRLISATNRNLTQEVKAGRFRLDLYFRLSVVTLDIPPLRERKADIPELVSYFLEKGGYNHHVRPDLLAALEQHTWPGNIRELENCIARLVALSSDDQLHVEDLPPWAAQGLTDLTRNIQREAETGETVDEQAADVSHSHSEPDSSIQSLDLAERAAIERALIVTNGNATEAARILGIGRTTLYRKRLQYGLKLESPTS